jgi:hypothetical protein
MFFAFMITSPLLPDVCDVFVGALSQVDIHDHQGALYRVVHYAFSFQAAPTGRYRSASIEAVRAPPARIGAVQPAVPQRPSWRMGSSAGFCARS